MSNVAREVRAVNSISHYRFLLIISLCFLLAGCVSGISNSYDTNVRSIAYWRALKSKNLEERIVLAPDAVVEYILRDNIKNGFPNKPFRPKQDKVLLAEVQQAVLSMPESVRKLVARKLVAIVLIGDLGSSGYSEIVHDELGNPATGFIALDVHAIDRKANDWATWKENSPFALDGKIKLTATIEEDDQNNRVQTIQYILLHEIGHIIAIGENFHPPWDKEVTSKEDLKQYPFASISWSFNEPDNKVDLLGTHDGFGCYPVYYYTKRPTVPLLKALPCYKALEKTSLISLYSGTNPFDDFAETFAYYVHVVLLGKPWRIKIFDSAHVYQYEPNWNDNRFKAKKQILESLLR